METKIVVNDDPWEEADNAKPRDFEYYGQVKADVRYIFFPGNKQRPIPFDPAIHPQEKRVVEIEIHIIPIPEQNVSFDVYNKLVGFSPDWTKITNPSIKALKVDGLRELNNRWVRVANVPGKRERLDKDSGEPTGEYFSTFKFLEIYPDENTCHAAYAGYASHTEPQAEEQKDEKKQTALVFAEVIVAKNAKIAKDRDELKRLVSIEISALPLISENFTVESPEIQTLIDNAKGL